jgi:hypothetical protein
VFNGPVPQDKDAQIISQRKNTDKFDPSAIDTTYDKRGFIGKLPRNPHRIE